MPRKALTHSSPNATRSGTTAEDKMDHESYPDSYLRDILTGVHRIAVVGASPRRGRPSHGVMAYLQRHGYRAIPVNPNAGGGAIHGETVHARLADIPEPVTWSMCSADRSSRA